MSAVRSRTRARTAAVAAASLVAAGFALVTTAAPAQAASTDLVINEVYLNGGSAGATYQNKYVEIRNRTGAAVSLVGKSIQYRAATTTGNSTGVVALTGSIPANGYYVLAGASNVNPPNGAAVPNQNQQSNTYNPSGGAGTTTLVNGTSAVDPSSSGLVIDKIGTSTSNSPEGTGVTGNSLTLSLGRTGQSTDTDNNSADFAPQTPTPGADNPGSQPVGGTGAVTVNTGGNRTNNLNDAVSSSISATGGQTPYTFSATGLPSGVNLNASTGALTGTASPAGTFTVNVTVTDSTTPTAKTGTGSFTWTITNPAAATPIADIQGTGSSVAITGTVTTEGVVTAAYPTRGLNGFFIQTPGTDTANASDAIFVYGGSSGFSSYPAIGDSVRVTGTAGENAGQSQITANNAGVTTLSSSLGNVTAKPSVPGTDCALPGTSCQTLGQLATAREAMEGELIQPTDAWTVTDAYDFSPFWPGTTNSSGHFGEIGLAASSSKPLVSPTEVIDAQAGTAIAERTNYNNAHRIILDDGSALNFTVAANTGVSFPWLTDSHSVRVGAAVTFPAPVVFTARNTDWRLIPTTPVAGAPTATQPQFSQTRSDNLAPQDVGGDVKLATFNVLNFFPTTGNEFVSSGLGTCSYYTDRAGAQITNNSCNPNGPRGAANNANLVRQRNKIVAAINASTADVISLEELENSVKFGKNRDFAINALVTALNNDTGTNTWAAVDSPSAANLPTVAEQDVIRSGFLYKPANVALVGDSVVLTSESGDGGDFEDAREPLAQAFKKVGSPDTDAFAVIVNHFKSKGSGTADPDGQGNANDRRELQAASLLDFADDFQALRNISRVFLVGDFNAYSHEDPIEILEAGGYTNLESTSNPDEESYNFDGQIGSLDHVLANDDAAADVDKVDSWSINSYESVYYEYSRYNYNVTDLYTNNPFRSSDHNPEIVGINVPDVAKIATTTTADNATVGEGSDASIHVSVAPNSGSGTPTGTVTLSIQGTDVGSGTLSGGEVTITADTDALTDGPYTVTATYGGDSAYDGSSDDATLTVTVVTTDIQILGTNDFHGRIQNDAASAAAGAAVLAGAVKSLRASNPNTVFAAAGDLIGASTFESFIAKDKPTIDALNSAGLEVSAAGNHEFDQGYNDLVNRVMAPYDATTNPYGGANWDYIAANVEFVDTDDPALDRVWTKTMNGVKVGFVGAVTEDLPTLVNPGGISQIEVTDIVDATNAAANQLKANGADVIVLLVHEGAPGTDCATMATQSNAFADIINGVNTKVDAIVSGHTHLEYNCSFEVPGWSGRPVTKRPVVSAGQYGAALNKLVFTVDKASGDVLGLTQAVLKLKSCTNSTTCTNYTPDAPTAQIVADAVAAADVLGAEEVGRVAEPFKRAYFSNGTTENRGGESTLGNLVAEVQRWVTDTPTTGNAQIAFMNPGGLRTDILGTTDSNTGLKVTYKQAANVQPFANTLVNMNLTGAQIKGVLEQQWQPGQTRPFLKLGVSQGFKYTYDPLATQGNRIKQMFLKGVLIQPNATYSVTVNSFLSNGGDGFTVLRDGTGKRDTGKVDLQAMVDYLAEFANRTAGDPPLTVDYAQRSVGVHFPTGAPASYSPGDHVVLDVSSFSMTNASDLKDTAVTVQVAGTTVGTATLNNTPQSGTVGGFDEVGTASVDVVLPALAPGTRQVRLVGTTTGTSITVPIEVDKSASTVVGEDTSVAINRPVRLAATVNGDTGRRTGTVEFFEGTTSLGSATLNLQGGASVTLPAGSLTVGDHTIKAVYSGDSTYKTSEDEFTVTVTKATTIVSATSPTAVYGKTAIVKVTVATAPTIPVSGTVTLSEGGNVVGTATVSGRNTNVAVTGLSAGVHTLDVDYTGDASVGGGTTTSTVTVTKAASKVTAKVNPPSPRAGKPVTVSGTVTGAGAPASGDVEIAVDGTTQTVTLDSAGTFSLSFPGGFTPAGSLDLVVTYLGNANLETSSVTKTITVRP